MFGIIFQFLLVLSLPCIAQNEASDSARFADQAASLIRRGNTQKQEGHFVDAAESVSAGLALARKIGNLEWIAEGLTSLADVACAREDYMTAVRCMNELSETKRLLAQETNIRSVHELEVRFEREKMERQIGILEEDNILRNLELQRRGDALRTQQLQAKYLKTKADLLRDANVIQQINLSIESSELRRQTARTSKRKKEHELQVAEWRLQLSRDQQTKLERNFSIAGLVLVLLFSGMMVVRMHQRRKTGELRAQVAEAESLRMRIDRDQLEQAARNAFTRQLIESQENERKRIAGNLHDSLSQELLIIKNQLALVLSDELVPEGTKEHIGDCAKIAANALADVRRISRNLRPVQIEQSGLTETLREFMLQLSRTTSVRLDTSIENVDTYFPRDAAINAFRIVQESVGNAIKHAGANRVSVIVAPRNGDIILSVEDDGRGFDTAAVHDGAGGLGLRNIRERARMLGGELRLHSETDAGTCVEVRIPTRLHYVG